MKRMVRLFVLVLTAALAACSGPRPAPPAGAAGPDEPRPAPGSRLFRITPEDSEIRILTYPDGPFAGAGHSHVIATRQIDGDVHIHADLRRSVFSLGFPVESLQVDDPALRSEEGGEFSEVVPESAREGTRKNLLGPQVLDAPRHPQIRVSSVAIGLPAPDGSWPVDLRVKIRDRWSQVRAPVRLRLEGDRLTAAGEFAVKQTDLGLEPFSALLGALRVQDEIRIRFFVSADAER